MQNKQWFWITNVCLVYHLLISRPTPLRRRRLLSILRLPVLKRNSTLLHRRRLLHTPLHRRRLLHPTLHHSHVVRSHHRLLLLLLWISTVLLLLHTHAAILRLLLRHTPVSTLVIRHDHGPTASERIHYGFLLGSTTLQLSQGPIAVDVIAIEWVRWFGGTSGNTE